MALLTKLPVEEAKRLGREFGLDVEQIVPLHEGSVNSNFRITTRDGRVFFARIYEEQAAAGALAEINLVRILDESSVPVVRSVPRLDGQALTEFEGKPFVIFPWLDGEILCQAMVTKVACTQIGAALARVHLASSKVLSTTHVSAGRFRIADLRERLVRVEQAQRTELFPAVERIRERLEHYERTRSQDLEQGVTHGDLFRDNVLWQRGSERKILALLDFESACSGNFAYDLMVTVQAWCYADVFQEELVRAMFAGYQSVRPLPEAERRALPSEGAIGALRFASTRLTDFSLRVAAFERPGRDYSRFLARLDAIEAGIVERCLG